MTEKHYTDQQFQVATSGWRAFWARPVACGEVYVSSCPLVGWMTQAADAAADLRVLPVVVMGDGTANALGRTPTADSIQAATRAEELGLIEQKDERWFASEPTNTTTNSTKETPA